jgi:hypothetical protein
VEPWIRNYSAGEPHQTQDDRGGDQDRQQIDARRILLDEHVPDQADIQVFVGAVGAEVEIRLAVVDQMQAGAGLVAIETQMQMRPADARQDQEGAGQKK